MGNLNEWERVFCEWSVPFVIFTFLRVSFVEIIQDSGFVLYTARVYEVQSNVC